MTQKGLEVRPTWRILDAVENIKNLLFYPLIALELLLLVLYKVVPMSDSTSTSMLMLAGWAVALMGIIVIVLVALVVTAPTKQKNIMF